MSPIDCFSRFEFIVVIGTVGETEPLLLARTAWAMSRDSAYKIVRDLFRDEEVVCIIEGGD